MRYTQRVELDLDDETGVSQFIRLSPRYSSFEVVVQRIDGDDVPSDVILQGAIENTPDADDWFLIGRESAIGATPVSLGRFSSTYNAIRLVGTSAGAVTLELSVVSTTDAFSDNSSSGGGDSSVSSQQLKLLLDDIGMGVSYVGEALPGSLTNSGFWRIKRLTETDADIAVEWADGNDAFDNIWDDRADLTYG